MINYELDSDGIVTLTFDMEGSANVLNTASVTAFGEALNRAIEDDAVKGIVLASAKRDFIVGGDLNEIFSATEVDQVVELASGLQGILRKMETCGKPAVAAINGNCLGGGYEVTLACHRRITVNSNKIQIGLPEVTLGVLPGGGGTQRLPRMIGVQAAMPLLLQGKRLRPGAALKTGLVDQLVDTQEELIPAAKAWLKTGPSAQKPWDKRGFQVPGGAVFTMNNTWTFAGAGGMVQQTTSGNYPAPEAILNCLYTGLQMGFDAALELEVRYFAKLVVSKEAKHMIRTLWFNMNKAKGGAARPKDVPPSPTKKLGMLGAGMMGAGIAYVTAKAGIPTVLKDISVESAEKGKAYSEKLLKKAIDRKRSTPEKAEALLSLIHPTDQASDLEGCDLIVEAVFEDRGLKAKVTQEAEAVMDQGGVFASNTSTLPITGLAEASSRPDNFIGLHFFSPVDKMQLVEIIMGEKTSDYALAKSIDYIQQIRKVPIVVNDSRGFYTSRIFKTYVYEGLELLVEGVKPALIENAAKMAGMPIGPLAVADEVSMELMYHILTQTEADGIQVEPNPKRVATLMVKELGRIGKKAGKGFYEYPEGGKKRLWKGLSDHFPVAETQPDLETVKKRILHVQAVESYRCLEEGVLRGPEDADIGSILGWGFPPYTGGALSYIDYVGIQQFVAECQDFAARFGPRFSPGDKLKAMAASGTPIYGTTETQPA